MNLQVQAGALVVPKVTLWFSILSVPSRSANSTLVSHSGEGNASMGSDRFLKPYGPESRMRSSDELQCHKLKEMFKIRDAAITFFLIPIRYRSLNLKLGRVRGLFKKKLYESPSSEFKIRA